MTRTTGAPQATRKKHNEGDFHDLSRHSAVCHLCFRFSYGVSNVLIRRTPVSVCVCMCACVRARSVWSRVCVCVCACVRVYVYGACVMCVRVVRARASVLGKAEGGVGGETQPSPNDFLQWRMYFIPHGI